MTTPLTTSPPPSREVEVPDGFWTLETTHAPLPWTPFTWAVLGETVNRGLREMCAELGLLFDGIEFREIGGWVYVQLVPLGGPPARAQRRVEVCLEATRCDVPGALLRRWAEQWRPELAGRITALREVDLAGLDDEQLDAHIGEVTALTEHGLLVHFRLHGALALALGELALICREFFDWDDRRIAELVGGTSSTSTAPARALGAVAGLAGRLPAVRRLVENGAPVRTVLAADQDFAAAFADYQREYGCRVVNYEIADPCLDEQPELALALIRDQLRAGFDPDAVDEVLRGRRSRARAEALRLLEERDPEQRHRFERALERALVAYPVREDNQFFTYSVPAALVRRAAREVGRRLVAAGLLDRVDEVFLLRPDHLRTALRERLDCRAEARRRARERAQALADPGPPAYGTPPGPPPSMSALPPAVRLANEAFAWTVEHVFGAPGGSEGGAEAAVTGVGASAGTYTGPARVIRGQDEFDRLRAGDVLVCPATSPTWSMLFASMGALVADAGGMLSHQAIIAREYGIPAVVGTGDGTSRLHDGQIVTVDGTTGVVRVGP